LEHFTIVNLAIRKIAWKEARRIPAVAVVVTNLLGFFFLWCECAASMLGAWRWWAAVVIAHERKPAALCNSTTLAQ